jgi:hypothetical protein
VLKFGVKTPINKNNSSSLILTNLELRFEACMLNLIWKWGAKDPKKREDHLIFINFGVKKFTLKNTPKKKTLTFECYNLLDPMEWGVVIFGGWCSTRYLQDPIVTSSSSHTFFGREIDSSKWVRNCRNWSKKQKEF